MAKKTKEQEVIDKLKKLGVEVNDNTPLEQLEEMLAMAGGKAEETKEPVDQPRAYKEIPCGVSSINDHERRITDLEYEVQKLLVQWANK